jgi:hypothetical protein
MRVNGILYYKIAAAASASKFNEDGEPIKQKVQWSDAIPCFIQTNTHDKRGIYEDGHFTQAKYIVLVERGKISETDRVRLNRLGSDLGEFTVQDFQNLCLDRVRIQV